jgi:hypothetical protein
VYTPCAFVYVKVKTKLLVQLSIHDLDFSLDMQMERATMSVLRVCQLVERFQELRDERACVLRQPWYRDSQEAVEEAVVSLYQELCRIIVLVR